MLSRFASFSKLSALDSATVESPLQVTVVGATTRIGKAVIRELTQGKWNLFFKVSVVNLSTTKKVEESFTGPCLDWDPSKPKVVDEFLKINETKTFVIAGSTDKSNSDNVKKWIDFGVKNHVESTLLLSVLGADSCETIWAKEYNDLEKYLVSAYKQHHVIIRSTLFTDNLLWHAPEIKREKTLSMPLTDSGYFAPVDTRDVATAVSFILLDRAHHDMQTYTITGPKVKSGAALAKTICKTLSTDIQYKQITMDAYRAKLKELCFKDGKIDGILSTMDMINQHHAFFVSSDFTKITKQIPTPMQKFIQEHVADFVEKEE